MTDDGFTQIANALLRSPELSGNAVKIFGFLASHRDGYGVTVAQILKHMKCKRDAVLAALKELEEFELLVRTRERRPDGTLGKTDYYITDREFLAREENRRSEPKSENPTVAVTSADAEESAASTGESEVSPQTRRSEPKSEKPTLANPHTKKTNNYKKTNELSVRPERNAGARDGAAADGRTDGNSPKPEPTPAAAPAEGSAAAMLTDPGVVANLARIDMRPEQRRRLEVAVDAALLRFTPGQVSRYLREKARDAETAMYVVRAFELYADAIALIGDPGTAAARRTDTKLIEDLATEAAPPAPPEPVRAPRPSAPPAPRKPHMAAPRDVFEEPGIKFVPTRLRGEAQGLAEPSGADSGTNTHRA